ncbi:MAG: DNA polymerase III subunit delta [Ferruginibacter sp.]
MSAEKIITAWKKKEFRPLYWFDGEEDYYIDMLMNYAEHDLLSSAESEFNLTVFYGKDADWVSIINACKRYPMFAERQVVLLKEAQHMKEIDKLESYVESPLSSTIFVVGYKGKSLDKRTKLSKLLSKNAELFTSVKVKEEKIHDWIAALLKTKGYTMKSKAISLLEEHIGNDLSRIANEIDKLSLNLAGKKEIDEDDIEKYIGISKEYNVFELLAAISKKDLAKAIQIFNYFESNPKAVPIQMALPALYSHFSKVYAVYGMNDKSDASLKPFFYYNPNSLRQAHDMMKNYGYPGIEKIILLLHQYNLKGVGVGDTGTSGASLMKEMVVKMMIDN